MQPKENGYLPDNQKFLVCPKYPWTNPTNGSFFGLMKVTYGMLSVSGPDSYYQSWIEEYNAPTCNYNFQKTRNPSAFFLIGETLQIEPASTTFHKNMRSNLYIQTKGGTQRPVFAHSNKNNLLFLDGHSESLSYMEAKTMLNQMLTQVNKNTGFMYWSTAEQAVPSY